MEPRERMTARLVLEVEGVGQHVQRQRHHHRPCGRMSGDLEGAPHGVGQVFGPPDLGGPLGERGRNLHQVVGHGRLFGQDARVLLTHRDHQWHAAPRGIGQQAHACAQSRAGVEIEEPDLAGGAGVALGHAHRDRLVQGQDVFDLRMILEGVDELDLGGPGDAESVLHALFLEYPYQRFFSRHHGHVSDLPVWMAWIQGGSAVPSRELYLKGPPRAATVHRG